MIKLSDLIREIMNGPGDYEAKRVAIEDAIATPGVIDDRTNVNTQNAEQPSTGLADSTLANYPITHGVTSAAIMGAKDLVKGAGKGVAQLINNLPNVLPFGDNVKSGNEQQVKARLQPSNAIQTVGSMIPDTALSYAVPSGTATSMGSKVPGISNLIAKYPKLAEILGAGTDNAMQSAVISTAKGSDSPINDALGSAAMGSTLKGIPVATEKAGKAVARHVLRGLSKSNGDEGLVEQGLGAVLQTKPTDGIMAKIGNALTNSKAFSSKLRSVSDIANEESDAFTKVSRDAHLTAYNSDPHITKTALNKAAISGTEGARMPASQLGDVEGYALPKLGYSRVDLGNPKLVLPEYRTGVGMIMDRLNKVKSGTDYRKYEEMVPILDPKTGAQTGTIPRGFKGFPNRLNGDRLPLTPEHQNLNRRVHNADLLEIRNELVDAIRNSDIATQGKDHASTLAKPLLSRIQPEGQPTLEKQLTTLLSKNPDIAEAITKRDSGAKRLEFMQEIMHALKPVPGKEAIAVSRVASGLGANAPIYTGAAALSSNPLRVSRRIAQSSGEGGRFNAIMETLRRSIPALNNN